MAVIYLQKLINTFHKEHPEKPTVISLLLDSALPIARPIIPKSNSSNKSVAVLSKEPIKEAEIRASEIIVPFVASNMDVVLKLLS